MARASPDGAGRAELSGERRGALGAGRRHGGDLHAHAVDVPVTVAMQARGEARADQADPQHGLVGVAMARAMIAHRRQVR